MPSAKALGISCVSCAGWEFECETEIGVSEVTVMALKLAMVINCVCVCVSVCARSCLYHSVPLEDLEALTGLSFSWCQAVLNLFDNILDAMGAYAEQVEFAQVTAGAICIPPQPECGADLLHMGGSGRIYARLKPSLLQGWWKSLGHFVTPQQETKFPPVGKI